MKKVFSLAFIVLLVLGAGGAFCASGKREGALRSPAWSPDGRHVAFLHILAGNTDVVIADLESEYAEAINVSGTKGAERDLAWSPDGGALLFSSQQGGNFDVCRFDVKSEVVECLTESLDDDIYPVWRPDGKQIAYCSYREGKYGIYTMDPDGGNQTAFYKPGACYPTWSPDGEKMALAHSGDIIVVDIESGRDKNITAPLISGDWVEDTFPLWSPTKDRIMLLGRFEAYLTEIYTMSSGGKKLARISDNVYEDFFPAWSPDGKWVVYAAYVPNRRRTTELFMSRDDASEKIRLTENWVFDISPSFSPDGERLLFVRREGLKDRLYVMTVAEEEEEREEKLLFPEGFTIRRKIARAGKGR